MAGKNGNKKGERLRGLRGTIYRRQGSPFWWIAWTSGGHQQFESSGTANRAAARKILNQRLRDGLEGLKGSPAQKITIDRLLDGLVQHYHRLKLKSLPQLKSRLKHLQPAFAHLRASLLTPLEIIRYQDRRLAEGASVATMNRELDALRRAFSLGIEHGVILSGPKIRLLPEDNVRTGFLRHEGYEILRDCLPSYLRLVLVVAYHLGLRAGEIRGLQRDQVDLKGGVLYLWAGRTKNRHGRTAPIYGDLGPELEMALDETRVHYPGCPWVCQHWGRQLGDFRKAWVTAVKKAGLGDLRPHDLRRTAVRNMLRAGISEKVVMQIVGHKTRAMLDRYNIISERDLKEAGAKMEAWLQEQTPRSAKQKSLHRELQ